jgi:UDP-2,3-diacylglucosamine pyrophosphatase LpxH
MKESTERREVDVVVISDVHLGTYGCRAKELVHYLKSIRPGKLILNGDIIDIWQFRKSYFPKSHIKVLKQILSLASKGSEVFYLTGNHDEMLRRFTDFHAGDFHLVDKLVLNLGKEKAWIFHGDIFDGSIQNAKWLAKLGGWGYDLLILFNSFTNWILAKLGKERYSLSKKIKKSVKKAVKYISDFENTAAELAIDKNYEYVICGHIHQPQIRMVQNEKGRTIYMNSGDWIENLSSLEWHNGKWRVYSFDEDKNLLASKAELDAEYKREPASEIALEQLIQKVTQTDFEFTNEEKEYPLRHTGNG